MYIENAKSVQRIGRHVSNSPHITVYIKPKSVDVLQKVFPTLQKNIKRKFI